jgi:hypothetical protein
MQRMARVRWCTARSARRRNATCATALALFSGDALDKLSFIVWSTPASSVPIKGSKVDLTLTNGHATGQLSSPIVDYFGGSGTFDVEVCEGVVKLTSSAGTDR